MKAKTLSWVLTIVEASILIVIGVIINQDPANKTLGEVFTVISFVIVVNRVINSIDQTTSLSEAISSLKEPISKLATIIDISTKSRVEDIRVILNIYTMIVNPELTSIKNTIIQRAIRELQELNYLQRTPVLDQPDFYNWLYTAFENAKTKIHIVSMDEELEWTDTPEERRFYKINVNTAQRGVELIRIFVFGPERLTKARNNEAIYGHRKGSNTKLIGKYVDKERFKRQASGAIDDAGQGFIVIDERMVIIDVFSEDGQARGYVTFNPVDIENYESLFRKFNAVATDLEFEDVSKQSQPPTL